MNEKIGQPSQPIILCRMGGIAALLAAVLFRRNIAEEYLLLRGVGIIGDGPHSIPTQLTEWFALLQQQTMIGLMLLNLFDMVNYALVGLIFLGLYAALRKRAGGIVMLAGAIGLMGTTLYLASNQAFPMLYLSNQFAASATDMERSALLAAGQALMAIQNSDATYGNGIFPAFLFVNIAGLLFSLAMWTNKSFGKAIALTGLLSHGLGLGYYVAQFFSMTLTAVTMSLAAIFLLIWYVGIGIRLLQIHPDVLE
jgi:hypothetical protein